MPVEVWVGPWKPHRPRGPIAAMYKSPGPTYLLPGATGPAAYMLPPVLGPRVVNKASAPNVFFGGRSAIGSFYEDLRKTPGPGTYQVVNSGVYKRKAPEYSMTGRNFSPGDTTKKPGPGAHHPERVTFTGTKAPSFSFGIRHSEYTFPLIVDGAD
ncbi:hypothetical protein cypCar_00042368 [Cyprinus carpio]|nr:hypothetical protein cypCar_00042368 [Cyprinus carpio]